MDGDHRWLPRGLRVHIARVFPIDTPLPGGTLRSKVGFEATKGVTGSD